MTTVKATVSLFTLAMAAAGFAATAEDRQPSTDGLPDSCSTVCAPAPASNTT